MNKSKLLLILIVIAVIFTALFVTGACNKSYRIIYETNGGETIASIEVSGVPELATPTKEGYTFVGWYTDADFNQLFDPESKVKSEITLYAKWEINSYTIIFNYDYGTEVLPILQNYGTAITVPEDPTKEGYTFGGWYISSDKTGDTYVFPETMPAEDITLYAKWTANEYTITFDSQDGSAVAPIEADYGATVTAPATLPTKEGYTFDGWYLTSDCTGNTYAFTVMPIDGITLYAKWDIGVYSIIFDCNGGNEKESVSYYYNEEIQDITLPSYQGHTFLGWYEDSQFSGELFNASGNMPAHDIILYARWDINEYQVNYYDGQTLLFSVDNEYGQLITEPNDPEKEGYSFSGWYTDAELTEEFLFNINMPANDMPLYSKWSINSYTISFETNSGSLISPETYEYGEDITSPEDPTRNDFYFGGWYEASDFTGDEFEWDTMPARNVTLYALWDYQLNAAEYEDGVSITGIHTGTVLPASLEIPAEIEYRGQMKTVYAIGTSAFMNKNELTAVTFAEGTMIKSISANAFNNCRNIVSFEIPDTILEIGSSAFLSCTKLVSLTISETSALQSIGESAFSGTILTVIFIPSGVTSLGTGFSGSSMTAINVSEENTSYSSVGGVLYNENQTEVLAYPAGKLDQTYALPSTVTVIKSSAFSGCKAKTIVLPEGLTTIGSLAFDGASFGSYGLQYIVIPSTVTSIGDGAFKNCTQLKEVMILGDSFVIAAGTNIFEMYGTLSKVYVNSTLLSNYQADPQWGATYYLYNPSLITAYDYTENGLVFTEDDSEYALIGYLGLATNLTIPAAVNTLEITSIAAGAFLNDTTINGLNVSDSVTSIEEGAFYGLSGLADMMLPFVGGSASATGREALLGYMFGKVSFGSTIAVIQMEETFYIPDSLISINIDSSIPDYAFMNCSQLASAFITERFSTYTIGDYAFSGCISLNFFGASANLTSIGDYAFEDCAALQDVCIGTYSGGVTTSNLASIGDYAFSGCDSLIVIDLYDNLTEIGAYAFKESGLTSITVPATVTSIGEYAFMYCVALTEVTFAVGSVIEELNVGTFYYCPVTDLALPESLTTIAEGALNGMVSLINLTIPFVGGSLTATGSAALFGYIFGEDSYGEALEAIKTIQYYQSGSYVFYYIPSSLRSVTVLGGDLQYGAFFTCSMLTSVILAEDEEYTIGINAFSSCTNLASIDCGENLTHIYNDAFYSCISLYDVELGISLTEIGKEAFILCSDLTEIELPDTLQTIGEKAFSQCGLTSITIPSSVTTLTHEAFYNSTSLETVSFGAGSLLETLELVTFEGCPITSLDLPEGITTIEMYALYGMSSLVSLTIPFVGNQVNAVGTTGLFGYIFGDTYFVNSTAAEQMSGTTYYIPSNLTDVTVLSGGVPSYGFSNCDMLVNVYLCEGTESYTIESFAFYSCDMLASVNFSSKLSSIGNAALSYCISLTDVVFGNSSELTAIGNMAFTSDTSLETIWLPASLTTIGNFSFAGTALTTVVLQSESVVALESDSFDYASITIYVPDSILSNYQTTYSDPGYSDCFEAIIE